MVTGRVGEGGPHPDDGLFGPQLDGRRDLGRHRAHPGAGGFVDPLGPPVGGQKLDDGTDWAPLSHGDDDRLRAVDEGVVERRRVVVGVPEVTAVDQLSVAGVSIEREGAGVGVHGHGDEPVGDDRPIVRLGDGHGMDEQLGSGGRPPEARDRSLTDELASHRRLVDV